MKTSTGFAIFVVTMISFAAQATEILHCTVGESSHPTYAYPYFKSFELNLERGQISGQYIDVWNTPHALVTDENNSFKRSGGRIQLHIDTWASHDHIIGDLNLQDDQGTLGVDESLDGLGVAGTTYSVTCTL